DTSEGLDRAADTYPQRRFVHPLGMGTQRRVIETYGERQSAVADRYLHAGRSVIDDPCDFRNGYHRTAKVEHLCPAGLLESGSDELARHVGGEVELHLTAEAYVRVLAPGRSRHRQRRFAGHALVTAHTVDGVRPQRSAAYE